MLSNTHAGLLPVCVCVCACVCMYAGGHIRVTSPATATTLKGKSVTKWSNGITVGHVNDETQQTVDFWNQSTHPHSSEASRLVNIKIDHRQRT